MHELPRHLLYSICARLGGNGLDGTAFESVRAAYRHGFLGRVVAYANRQREIPARFVHSLRIHPLRVVAPFGKPHYYGAKRRYLDEVTARQLRTGEFDFFHGWSGSSLQSLRTAREMGIPSVLEIPTWHRNRGILSTEQMVQPRPPQTVNFAQRWADRLITTHETVREEYEWADLILTQSECAAESFVQEGFPAEKLFHIGRGVDIQRFIPGRRPQKFRALFVGTLLRRKGVHHLLEAWKKLDLKDAELVLSGSVQEEIKPLLADPGLRNVILTGFVKEVEKLYQECSLHIFPSQCEGSAKCTYEAAASGLAQITTREAGAPVRHGLNGLLIPSGDVQKLMTAIEFFYRDRAALARMGDAARHHIVENFTWDHFRSRLRRGYSLALERFSLEGQRPEPSRLGTAADVLAAALDSLPAGAVRSSSAR